MVNPTMIASIESPLVKDRFSTAFAKGLQWVISFLCLYLFLLLLPVSPAAAGTPQAQEEYKLKAAYLYKFTKFINWPDNAFDASDGPLNICIKGRMPDPDVVEKLQRQKTRGHPLTILPANSLESLSQCHVIYFRQVERNEVRKTLRQVQDLPVLTVGEYRGFARDDGIIEFEITASRRIKLVINQARAKNLQILISAQLLEIAAVLKRA